MRRQLFLASVGAIALVGSAFAGSAFAADLTPPPPPPPPAPIFSWTGLYVGAQIGYAWGSDTTDVFFTPPGFPGVFVSNSFGVSPQGVIGGAHIGYNLQINQWVAGLEGTVDGTSLSNSGFDAFGIGGGLQVNTRAPVQGSVRLRAGFAWDRVLIYATGGVAFTGIHDTYTDFSGLVTGVPGVSEEVSKTRAGWTVGGGLEYALTDNWSVRAEYRYSDFGHYTDTPLASFLTVAGIGLPVVGAGILSAQHHLTENQVELGLSYKFGSPAPAPVVAKY